MAGGTVREMTPSGQYSQQMKQAGVPLLAGMQMLGSMTGLTTLHEPVLPASPGPGSLWEVLLPYWRVPTSYPPITVFSYASSAALAFSSGLRLPNSSLMAAMRRSMPMMPVAIAKEPMMPELTIPSRSPAC